MPSAPTPTRSPLDSLRHLVDGAATVPQGQIVDLLLDCYSGSDEPAVRDEITGALRRIARRSLLTAAEVVELADVVAAATEVEAAYAHLLLAS